MLGQHLNHLIIRHPVIQVITQFCSKCVKGPLCLSMTIALQQGGDSVDMGLCNPGDIRRPLVPVMAISTLLNDLCVQRALNVPKFI